MDEDQIVPEVLPEVLDPHYGIMRGYRTWRIKTEDGTPELRSLFHHTDKSWVGKMGTAYCTWHTHWEFAYRPKVSHQPPAPKGANCGCGLFAYFDWRPTRNQHLDEGGYGLPTVAGVVDGQGIAEWCETGFRSSKAEVVALTSPRRCEWGCVVECDHDAEDELRSVRRSVAEAIGVPFYDRFEDMVRDFPPTHEDEFREGSALSRNTDLWTPKPKGGV